MTPQFRALGRLPAGKMNRTEAEYAAMLELRKHAGEVIWWEFEPFKIRLADRTFYDIDFGVMLADRSLEVHEVKGGFITDDGRVKLKVAASRFPAQFFLAQKVKKAWSVTAL
jgi:hypothetical protein